jgi:hypothetical protein
MARLQPAACQVSQGQGWNGVVGETRRTRGASSREMEQGRFDRRRGCPQHPRPPCADNALLSRGRPLRGDELCCYHGHCNALAACTFGDQEGQRGGERRVLCLRGGSVDRAPSPEILRNSIIEMYLVGGTTTPSLLTQFALQTPERNCLLSRRPFWLVCCEQRQSAVVAAPLREPLSMRRYLSVPRYGMAPDRKCFGPHVPFFVEHSWPIEHRDLDILIRFAAVSRPGHLYARTVTTLPVLRIVTRPIEASLQPSAGEASTTCRAQLPHGRRVLQRPTDYARLPAAISQDSGYRPTIVRLFGLSCSS